MSSVNVEKGISANNMSEIYSDAYIIDAISFGDKKPFPVIHELADYVSVFIDGEFVGAILVIHYSGYETEIHSLLLKKSRRYSREICKCILKYCFDECEILRVTGYVMEKLNSAKNNLLKCGFTYEGFRRHCYMKNGAPEGIHILGITRQEWRDFYELNR
jgi:RimJ/RimL family protein N-acetyltransferase